MEASVAIKLPCRRANEKSIFFDGKGVFAGKVPGCLRQSGIIKLLRLAVYISGLFRICWLTRKWEYSHWACKYLIFWNVVFVTAWTLIRLCRGFKHSRFYTTLLTYTKKKSYICAVKGSGYCYRRHGSDRRTDLTPQNEAGKKGRTQRPAPVWRVNGAPHRKMLNQGNCPLPE